MSTTTISQSAEPTETSTQPRVGATTPTAFDAEAESNSANARLADSTPPEGGYGWVVVAGSATLTFWFNGLGQTWGVMQTALFEQGLSSTSTLSFVGSLFVTIIVVLGLLSTQILYRLGARTTGLIGMSIFVTGELLSGFSTRNVGGLFVTTGVLLGLGGSPCFIVASLMPAQYFRQRLGLANGIVKAGGGIGGTVLSFIIDALLRELGPAWTFRIIGFMTLATGIPAAWVIKERVPIQRSPFVDWRLFRDTTFVAVFLTGVIGTFALYVPVFFLPLFSRSIGLSSQTGAGLVAGFNLCTTIGRLGSGLLCDSIGPLNTFFLAMLLNAISILAVWPIAGTLPPLIVFAVLNGMANGAFFTTMPTVVSSIVSSNRESVAMGMTVTGWSGGYLMGAPIAGYMLQAFGGEKGNIRPYRPGIFYAGSVAFASSLLVLLARLKLERKVLKKV